MMSAGDAVELFACRRRIFTVVGFLGGVLCALQLASADHDRRHGRPRVSNSVGDGGHDGRGDARGNDDKNVRSLAD